MAKQILTGKEMREKLFSGVKQIADTVTITLGPKGRNVGLDKKWIEPQVLHDGVSVAREIELPDPFENFAAQLIKQSSSKTNDRAGDGTTTSMLLSKIMIEKGYEYIEKGVNPMTMKEGIEMAANKIVEELKKQSIPVETKEQIEQVATVSSANKELGKMIAEAMNKVGKEGVISVEESARMETSVEYKEGMEFDKGYMSPYFSTNIEKQEVDLIEPHILITDQTINSASEIATFLKRFVDETKRVEIVIITPRMDNLALGTLLINKERGGIMPVAIYAPGFAEKQREILEDIAVLTGGTLISREKGIKVEDTQGTHLGRCEKIWCDKDNTKIIGGFGDPKLIEERANHIRNLIEKEDSDFEKEKLKERLARLISGAALIKVGAMTEVELKERKERVIDAVEATKSAMEEGIVVGGGIALFKLTKTISELKNTVANEDIKAGIDVVYHALLAPLTKIISNAGGEPAKVIADITVANEPDFGYNVETGEFGNLLKKGIVDPTKVTRSAVQNAASVAALILTMEAVVTDIPEKKDAKEGTE